jgi:hypothetical protein
MIPRRASSVADASGRWRGISQCPRPRTSPSKLLRSCSHNARNRSRVECELALRPGFLSPSPEAHRRRYVRHEAWGGGYWF